VRRVVLAALMALAGCASGDSPGGEPWPDVVVEDLATGQAVSSQVVLDTDRVSVIAVWAVWCTPCRKELPALDELGRRRSDDLAVGAINHGDDPAQARAFLDELDVGFSSLRDPDARLVSALGVASLPATFVVDAAGRITWSRLGVVEVAEIEAAVEAAVEPSRR
jgi:thiol-disulfide isomerase/thioredoxin